MRRRALVLVALAWLLGGCAVPSWVPLIGKDKGEEEHLNYRRGVARRGSTPRQPAKGATGGDAVPLKPDEEKPAAVIPDDVTDRIVAVVNNDAITLAELQENVAAYRHETKDVKASDDELSKQFLTRLIDTRLQLQEADRDKITVDDTELNEELADRMKKVGASTQEQFEAAVRAQGLTMDAVKRRLREALRIAKVVRRKVGLRVSVTDAEIDRYLDENRVKLETGLAYHARNILIPPEGGADDAAWERARIRAEMIRQELIEGADFAEVAAKYSKDASAKDGGDLGILKRGELAQDIETMILSLKPGEISKPYRSQLGYHLFRLESREALEGEGLTRVRQQIRDILFRQKYEARLAAWMKEIKERAIIEVRL